LRDGRGHTCDVTDLVGEVARHRVDVIGQILPDARDVLHHCLTAQLTFRTHFSRHTRYFRCECVKLVHHDVNGVLQLQNFALRVDVHLALPISLRDGRRHTCDVTDLVGEVARHEVDVIRQILPHAADVLHLRLTAQLTFRTHFARHARNFRCERAKLTH